MIIIGGPIYLYGYDQSILNLLMQRMAIKLVSVTLQPRHLTVSCSKVSALMGDGTSFELKLLDVLSENRSRQKMQLQPLCQKR